MFFYFNFTDLNGDFFKWRFNEDNKQHDKNQGRAGICGACEALHKGQRIKTCYTPVKDALSDWKTQMSMIVFGCLGVSKNRGTPKWMVYNGTPY